MAATGLLAVGSAAAAIKIGTAGVGAAMKAAFAPAAAGGGAAAAGADQAAQAQRALRDATQNAADSNVAAARQVEQAERSLSDAQRSAQRAQQDLNDARGEAVRDLEDLNNRLTDAGLDQRANTLRVQQSKEALDKVLGDGTASELQRQQAQLTYDQAKQKLAEQGTAYERLKVQVAAANTAGVDGSKRVTDAQAKVADANRNVADQVRAVGDAQTAQARTAQKGLEAIQAAQDAMNQKTASAGGGVDAFAAAMAKLAPAAREFVGAVQSLAPAWTALKLDVQQALFLGLADSLKANANSVLPVLRERLTTAASALNLMGKGAMDAAGTMAKSGVLGQALDSANNGLYDLRALPATIVQGLVQIGAAAGPAFERLTSAGGGALDRLSARMSAAFASGGMQTAIEQAITLIGQLGTVAGNIGHVLGSVFQAADVSGGSYVQTLVKITDAMATAFASPEVQSGLRALFTTVSTLASTAAPLLITALQVIGPVLAELGPPVQALVVSLGAALQPILVALGPVLVAAAQAAGQLVTAALPLLGAVSTLATALLPALTPLLVGAGAIFAQLAPLVTSLANSASKLLGPVIAQLAPLIQTLVSALSGFLAPILATLPGLIEPIVEMFATQLAAELPILTQLIQELPLAQLGQSFADVAIALTPVLAALSELLTRTLPLLMPLLTPIIDTVGKLATLFADELAHVITAIVVPALTAVSQILRGDFSGAVDSVKTLIKGMITEAVRLLAELPFKVLGALIDLAGNLIKAFAEASIKLTTWLAEHRSDIMIFFIDLPDRILDALGDLGSLLLNAGKDLIKGLIDGIKSSTGSLKNALSGVTDLIPDWKGPPERDAQLLTPAGQSIMGGLMDGIAARVPDLRAQLQGITAQMAGALAGPSLSLAGNAGALSGAYAGMGRPVQQNNVINLYGSSLTPADISSELSWKARVGVR